MTALAHTKSSFVEAISKLVLTNNPEKSDFPLRVRIDENSPETTFLVSDLKDHLDGENLPWNSAPPYIEVSLSTKEPSDRLLSHLQHQKWKYVLDYSQFATHPGMVFVRGLQKTPGLQGDLKSHFAAACRYGLVSEVNVIGNSDEGVHEVAATVKFDNHLDADHILSCPSTSAFGPKPLHVTRYVSKKQRAIQGDVKSLAPPALANDDPVIYDTIVVENFNEFVAEPISISQVQNILLKFELFLPIETVFFPLTNKDTDKLRFKKVGFIGLSQDRETNSKLLTALYYLNDLTFLELLAFSQSDVYDLSKDLNTAERDVSSNEPRLKMSIAQRKHNHHLYENSDSPYVFLNDKNEPSISEPDLRLHESEFINRFIKSSNYQETNVYVNNFPIIFGNDDALWAEFWNQFGVDHIKSAKIIKPQFYSKKLDGSLGKIGFVFYKEFKMALRAIILTNNKVIRYKDSPSILIQASFAIQKHSSHSQAFGKAAPQKFHHNTPPNYYPEAPLPKQYGGASPFMPIPDQYMFHPYMMSMPPYNPGMPLEERVDDVEYESNRDEPNLGVASNSFPPQFGYYFPYYPFSGQMPVGGPIPPPMLVAPASYGMQYPQEKKERKTSRG